MVYCEKCTMDVPNAYHWREKYKHSKVCCRCVSEIDLVCISKYQREIINLFNHCSSSFEPVSSSEIYETCKKISEESVNGQFFFAKYMKMLSMEKINTVLAQSFGENFEFDDLTDDQLKQWINSLNKNQDLFDYFEEDDVTREEMQEFILSNVSKEIDDLTDDQLKQWINSLNKNQDLFDYFEEDDVTREEMQEFILSNVSKEIDYDKLVEFTWFLAENTPPFYYIENLQESDMMNAFEKMNLTKKNVHFNLL